MKKVTNNIPDCSPVVSELLNRAVSLGASDLYCFSHRVERLSARAINSKGNTEGEALRDMAAEAVVRNMLSTCAVFMAPQEIAELFRQRNSMKPKQFLFEVCSENPESWNAVKSLLVRSCTSLVLSGGVGAASSFDACHTVLNGYGKQFRLRELTALVDAAETALALPV